MMSAYANSLQKPERFDLYVRKFRTICAMHGVQIGSRMGLSSFMGKLLEDRHLAMDFWAFISKLSNREGGELSDDQMLGVVVEGITDREISQADSGQKRTVDDLRAMLAGVDIHGHEPRPVEMAPFPRTEAVPERGDELWRHAAEAPIRPSNTQASYTPEQVNGHVDHPAVFTTPLPSHLDEALLRRELTRLVQQYFENIDNRISELEPHPGVTSMGTIATAVTRRSLEEPATREEMEELSLRRRGRTRLVLEPVAPPIEDSPAPRVVNDVPIPIPLEHYSQQPAGFGTAPLLLILVLLGSALALYRDPTLVRKGWAVLVRQFQSDGPVTSAILRVTRSSPTGREPIVKPTEPSPPAAVLPALEGTSNPPPISAPDQTASAGSQSAGNNSGSRANHRTITDRPLARTEQTLADGISRAEAAGAIQVSGATMEANLIASRVPVYPEAAKIARVAGHVVMQAIISKEGTVKHLHVTEGDSRLRAAAEDAVYKWRYRPYLLHGHPVEVATIITVEFNLYG